MENQLWKVFIESSDGSTRHELIEYYLPFAKKIATRLYMHWSYSEIDVEDFIQYATVGLIEAIDRYDFSKGNDFKRYAQYRIKGAILNSISSYSENLSYVAFRRQAEKERVESFRDYLKDKKLSKFSRFYELTIGSALILGLDEIGAEVENKLSASTPYGEVSDYAYSVQICTAIENLRSRSKQILKLHYLEQMTFSEVADCMKLSRTSVSLGHAKALVELKRRLSKKPVLDKVF